MRFILRTVQEVYMRRLRTRKVMVRLLQQSQHALSTVGGPKAKCTNDTYLQSVLLIEWRGTGARESLPLCCPGADRQRNSSANLHDDNWHPFESLQEYHVLRAQCPVGVDETQRSP